MTGVIVVVWIAIIAVLFVDNVWVREMLIVMTTHLIFVKIIRHIENLSTQK